MSVSLKILAVTPFQPISSMTPRNGSPKPRAYIPTATRLAVNNEGKTNEATKNVQEPLQRGQTAPKDETQQKQQRKPKGPKP